VDDPCQCQGYIEFFFLDARIGFNVSMGTAGFATVQDRNEIWERIGPFEGITVFSAALEDIHGQTLATCSVDAEMCERFLGRPVAQLINDGRNNLNAVVDSLAAKRRE
jgi:hypothetical protein